jgi:rubredoxin
MSEPVSLPPFFGDTPTCPMCGHQSARTTFIQIGSCSHYGRDSLIIGCDANERLHRECGRCGFAWDEATVEQQPVKIEDRGTE